MTEFKVYFSGGFAIYIEAYDSDDAWVFADKMAAALDVESIEVEPQHATGENQ